MLRYGYRPGRVGDAAKWRLRRLEWRDQEPSSDGRPMRFQQGKPRLLGQPGTVENPSPRHYADSRASLRPYARLNAANKLHDDVMIL